MPKLVAITVAAMLLTACGEEVPSPVPIFHSGQYVRAKLDGRRGMVTGAWCWRGDAACSYYVRFGIHSSATNTSLLGSDGDIQHKPYSTVRMEAFELEAAN